MRLWREQEKDLPQAALLRQTILELDEALKGKAGVAQLKFLLGGLFRVR